MKFFDFLAKNKIVTALSTMFLLSVFCLAGCFFAPSENSQTEDISDISISESSDVDESTVSEPSDASEVEESLVDISDTSKDPAPETSTPAEESDVSEPETSEVETSKAPDVSDDPPSDESSEPSETSKVEEPSQPDEPSEPEHAHTWAQATCTSPKTCKTCGETEGTTTAHDWQPSSCIAPKTCKTCGVTEGSVTKGHSYENGKCRTCGAEEDIVHGDTPVDIIINGKQETVDSYEEATKLLADTLTVENLETAEKGYVLVLELKNTRTFTANGDGTFVCSKTGRNYTAEKIIEMFKLQFCSDCGKRTGHGDNGTCVKMLIDTECDRCGVFCKAQECHTCNDDND